VISFQWDGDRYEVRLPRPLIGSGGSYNLYVLADPAYRPNPETAGLVLGGIDRIENLLKR
jgi:hypothetical protein